MSVTVSRPKSALILSTGGDLRPSHAPADAFWSAPLGQSQNFTEDTPDHYFQLPTIIASGSFLPAVLNDSDWLEPFVDLEYILNSPLLFETEVDDVLLMPALSSRPVKFEIRSFSYGLPISVGLEE